MNLDHHTPSLSHLREFVRARSRGRPTHVARDREQVADTSSDQFYAFAYEKFISAVLQYVRDGRRGPALERAVSAAAPRMQASYQAAARGVTMVLNAFPAVDAHRQQRNVIAHGRSGERLVSLRTHIVFEMEDGAQIATHLYFSEGKLTEAEITVVETAIALAAIQAETALVPALMMVRSGSLRIIDIEDALTEERVQFLEREAAAYLEEWDQA